MLFSRNPNMKMRGKANAFFFPGSYFLFLSFFPHDFHRKEEAAKKQ
jgi:hypothetical protein